MKNSNKVLNLLTAFLAVIGACAATLVCFIVIYSQINGGFSPKTHDFSATSSETNPIRNDLDINLDSGNYTSAIISSPEPDFDIAFTDEKTNSESSLPETVKPVKSGTYTIDAIEFWFSDSVMNDVTGRWRISSIASSKDIAEYIIDYYNTLFSSNDEIHAIVNFSLNTTTSISVLPDGTLDVAIHEYIDGEEHDVKALFSGMLLKEYFVNPQTGEFEENTATSSTSPIENNGANATYSYEIPIENSNQMTISSASTESDNDFDFNTYNTPNTQDSSPGSDTVWLSATGKKYHSINNCGKMDPNKAHQVSLEYAISEGYEKCDNCF